MQVTSKLRRILKSNVGMLPFPMVRRTHSIPKPMPRFKPKTGDICRDVEIDCENFGRVIFNPKIALCYARKLLGWRFEYSAEDAAQEAYLLWIKQNGKIHPRRCVLSAVSRVVKAERLRDAVAIPLDSDNSVKLARRQTGLSISDLPDGLRMVAELTIAGYTTREITSRTGLHPRDIVTQRHDIGCYLSEHSPRNAIGDRMELAKDHRHLVPLDKPVDSIETRLCRAWDQSLKQA